MKHVFVETNFIVDVARPLPSPEATRLLSRAQSGDVTLHIPWVALAEAKRTLERIIKEDLGFTNAMSKFVAREFLDGQITSTDKKVIESLSARASAARGTAIRAITSAVAGVAAHAAIIEPGTSVVTKVLTLFSVKSLKPFDEMVLGAVLAKAQELHRQGETDLWFCNLNKNDFDPTNHPALTAEYQLCGLRFLASFAVPT